MTVKKTFAYSILALFAVILMVPASSGAGETRVISHDGINGWACWTSGSVPCGGGHDNPITVQQSSDYGKPTPSLKITGNVLIVNALQNNILCFEVFKYQICFVLY